MYNIMYSNLLTAVKKVTIHTYFLCAHCSDIDIDIIIL